jgi:hypothetical protein
MGFNLPDNVSVNDPRAPWNQVDGPTTVKIKVHYNGQVLGFEKEWDFWPTEEEVSLDFGENYHLEVIFPEQDSPG